MRANKNAKNLERYGSPEAKAFDAAQDPVPEDIQLDIGTKDRAIWEEFLTARKVMVEALEKELVIEKELIRLAERRVAEEKEKFK